MQMDVKETIFGYSKNSKAMNSISHDSSQEIQEDRSEEAVERLLFWDSVSIIFKATGMITWFLICLLMLLEIKRYFNIDFIPGYDSAIDDAYGAMRGTITNLRK